MLLNHGADVNPRHPESKWTVQWWHIGRYKSAPSPITPLAAAVCYAPEFKATLLSAGAELGQDKGSVLIGASYIDRPDVMPALIKLGADVNGVVQGETPLTQAVRTAPKAVPILLAHGARPDVLTTLQQSPLVEAVISGDKECVRQLLAHNAGVNFRAERGHTPLWYAERHNRTEIITMLKKAGGRNE
jgi:ankyrin repeat protein